MKGNLFLAMAFAVLGLTANAQEKKNDNAQMPQRPTKEQMVEMQVNRMANKLMLDEATTSKFTPVYKKYLEENGIEAQEQDNDVLFSINQLNFIFRTFTEDPNFVQLILPNVDECSARERREVIAEINRRFKVAKIN